MLVCLLGFAGCGSTKSFTATEQLLMSDAVDTTIAKIDFSPLHGRKVYLDTTFLTGARTNPNLPNSALSPQTLINADYVVSSVRQQMIAAGCLIEEKRDDADLVAEVRIGALGTDGHSITYGLPQNNLLSNASSVVGGVPTLPTIPEIAFAKKELKSGAAKIAVFAYDRQSHQAVWQSGIEQAGSNSRDTWVLGVGPFQRGTIYGATRFAGKSLFDRDADDVLPEQQRQAVGIRDRHLFVDSQPPNKSPAVPESQSSQVVTASNQEPAPASPPPKAP